MAKNEIVAVVRWSEDTFEKPWKVDNTTGISELLLRLLNLNDTCDGLVVALESTGNYSEVVRHAAESNLR